MIQLFNLIPNAKYSNTHRGRVYDPEGVAPTVFNYAGGGNRHAKIIVYVDDAFKQNKTERIMAEKEKKKIALPKELEGKKFRIRKLTPRECGRLMDVDDDDIDKMVATGLSNSALYRLFGNSIVISPMYHIFKKLLIEKQSEDTQLSLF